MLRKDAKQEESKSLQANSTKEQAPAPSLSKAPRPSLVPIGSTEIGPGEYGSGPAACDVQLDSKKLSCSMVKFGTGYKSGIMEKPILPEPSPGPGSYAIPGSIATQLKGTPYRNAPAATMSGYFFKKKKKKKGKY